MCWRSVFRLALVACFIASCAAFVAQSPAVDRAGTGPARPGAPAGGDAPMAQKTIPGPELAVVGLLGAGTLVWLFRPKRRADSEKDQPNL